ncbi:MAG: DNA topoisomerase IV subunit A [Alphaproteobacteria bacterium]
MANTSRTEMIQDTPLDQALGERYLSYALSTITARSLPDVRDGLKPVHRRILYAMWESGNTSNKTYRKSASSVGYVMMRYHPHGEGSIYDALVRMAQDFAMRYPLVDGQGNFGSLDGDSAAAMRYTEARLTPAGEALLAHIGEDAVDMVSTYNGEYKEPTVLPASFPNLLANGATGIAVGMATNIPPHNISEICDALRHVLKSPDAGTKSIMRHLKGPDFPTGGIITEDLAEIEKSYDTGRGSMRVRARWEVEKLKGGQYQIVITELPYQVQKSRLIEKIADLLLTKKLPLLGDVLDESTADVRIVLTPKSRTVDADILMALMFKHTDLESRFSLNMNVIDADGTPRVLPIRDILQAFLNHRHQVLLRRSEYRLKKIAERLEILQGFQVAYLNIDEVIKIIRFEDDPRATLIERFSLTDLQADAILNMRLRALRKLEEIEIKQELDALTGEKAELDALLASTEQQWQRIDDEISELKKTFGSRHAFGKRRTTFENAPDDVVIPIESVIEREPVSIVCSTKGWIRAVKGHNHNPMDVKYKEGDSERFLMNAFTTDQLLVLTEGGMCHTVKVDQLPRGRGFGDPLTMLCDIQEDKIFTLMVFNNDTPKQHVIAASDGRGFVINTEDLTSKTKRGKKVLNPGPKAITQCCIPVEGEMIASIGDNRRLLIFKLAELPQMGRGRGVRIQFFRDGGLSDLCTFKEEDGLSWNSPKKNFNEKDLTMWLGRRGQSGRYAPIGFPRSNKFKN